MLFDDCSSDSGSVAVRSDRPRDEILAKYRDCSGVASAAGSLLEAGRSRLSRSYNASDMKMLMCMLVLEMFHVFDWEE